MAAARRALRTTTRLWQQSQKERDNLGRAKSGTRKKMKGREKTDKVNRIGSKYLKWTKLTNAYVKNEMADKDFGASLRPPDRDMGRSERTHLQPDTRRLGTTYTP